MSKILMGVAIAASVVALAATGLGVILGPAAFAATFGATAATVASIASAVAAVASVGASLLQKPPDMKGTVSEVMIGVNMPIPYGIGRTYLGGMKIYDDSSNGPEGHPNKDRHQVFVYSHAGPIDSFEGFYGDYSLIGFSGGTWTTSRVATGYYGADDGYLWLQAQTGLRPQTTRLSSHPGRTSMHNWPSSAKLSGMAAATITMEFDEEGERFAGGIPAWGVVAKWVKIYDPRLDSTYPGGSGSQLWDDESTWTWSENPGLHALTYARGRFMGPANTKVIGPGIPKEFIDIPAFVELANTCDANGWTVGGALYEGPGISRWDNLKRVLASAAAAPAWVGGMLTVKASAPMVSIATITADDLADGDAEVQAVRSWKDKFNAIVPRYRSEAHRWEYVQAEAVENATYITEDGELKTDEVQYDLCQDVDQAAQLAAYDLVNRREFGPIKINCKPHLMGLKPGEAVTLDIEELGLNGQLCRIESRSVDPGTGAVSFTLSSETTSKHAYALGQTGVAPPTPSIATPETVDTAVVQLGLTTAEIIRLIDSSKVSGLTFSSSSTGAVTISNHTRIYDDKTVSVTGTGGTPIATLGTNPGRYFIYYDDPDRAGGAVTYSFLLLPTGTGDASSTSATPTNPYRHFVATGVVPASGSSGGGSGVGEGGSSGLPCVTVETEIELADGSLIPAGEIAKFTQLRTDHEETGIEGIYHVSAVEIVPDQDVWTATINGKTIRATGDHRLKIDGEWVKIRDIGTPDGTADVVKMTVADAHTYVSNGLLSHNVKVSS